jgi:Rrf2 family iron-sulfur cluster assembly transcriptional regulator
MPKFLTSRGDYGLLLTIFLADYSGSDPKPISEIASFFNLPQAFLEQIALDLRRAHLVSAKRGKDGGYFLTREPNRISVIEVIEAAEGPLQIVTCQGGKCASSPKCTTHDFWLVLQKHIHKTLREITLADLVKQSPHKLLPLSVKNERKNS